MIIIDLNKEWKIKKDVKKVFKAANNLTSKLQRLSIDLDVEVKVHLNWNPFLIWIRPRRKLSPEMMCAVAGEIELLLDMTEEEEFTKSIRGEVVDFDGHYKGFKLWFTFLPDDTCIWVEEEIAPARTYTTNPVTRKKLVCS